MRLSNRLSRRQLILTGTLTSAATLLAACAAPAQTATPVAVKPPEPAKPAAAAPPTNTPSPAAPTKPTEAPKPTEPTKPAAAPAAAPAAKAGQQVRLQFWFWGAPAEKNANEKIAADYTASNPGIVIEPVHVPQQYETKFETAAAGGSAPDTFYIGEAPYYRWACHGLLLDQKPYLDAQNINPSQRWFPIAQYVSQGKYYGTAIALEPILLYYNNDLFKKAGLPEPPNKPQEAWKWADFVAAAKKLTVDSAGKRADENGFDRSKVQTWGVLPGRAWNTLDSFVYQTGALPFGKGYDKSQITDPAFVNPLQAVADLGTKDNVAPMPTDLASLNQPATTLFLSGKIAMMINGQWSLQVLTEKPPPFDLRLAVLPRVGDKFMTEVTCPPTGVLAKAKSPDEAVKFALFFTDNERNLLNLQTGLWMPTMREFYQEPRRKIWYDDFKQHHPPHYVESAIGSLEHTREPMWKHFAGYFEAWSQMIQPALDPVWLGQKTVKDAMEQVRPQMDEMLQKRARECPPIPEQ